MATPQDKKPNTIAAKFQPNWKEIPEYVLYVWAKPTAPEDMNPEQFYAVQKDAKKYTRPGVEDAE